MTVSPTTRSTVDANVIVKVFDCPMDLSLADIVFVENVGATIDMLDTVVIGAGAALPAAKVASTVGTAAARATALFLMGIVMTNGVPELIAVSAVNVSTPPEDSLLETWTESKFKLAMGTRSIVSDRKKRTIPSFRSRVKFLKYGVETSATSLIAW